MHILPPKEVTVIHSSIQGAKAVPVLICCSYSYEFVFSSLLFVN